MIARARSRPILIFVAIAAGSGCNLLLSIEDQRLRPEPPDAAAPLDAAPTSPTDGGDSGAAVSSRYARAVLADRPILYLRFGDASGPAATDLGGRFTVTYPASGSTLGVPGALAGDPDTAVSLGGISPIRVSEGADFLAGAAFSVELWFKRDPTIPDAFLVDHASYPSREGWDVYLDGTSAYFERWGAGAMRTTVSATRGADNPAWHHLVGTWDGAVQRIYLDGELGQAGATAVTIGRPAGPFTIGGQNCECTSNFYTGALDELAIYDRALTPQQIAAHLAASR